MADRAIEPRLPRREPGTKVQLLTPAELDRPSESKRAGALETPPCSKAAAPFSFLALFDPLPSDYYLG